MKITEKPCMLIDVNGKYIKHVVLTMSRQVLFSGQSEQTGQSGPG